MKFFSIPHSTNPSDKPPRQDPELWGHKVLVEADSPHDWCTVAQAAEHSTVGVPDSLLRDICEGRIQSGVYSQEEARQLLEKEQGRRGKER